MKLFWIKVGKVWSLIRQEGVFVTVQRLREYTKSLRESQKIEPGEVLFIASGLGASALYRTHHIAEMLEYHGIRCSVTTQYNKRLRRQRDCFQVFVFHRTLITSSMKKFIESLQAKNKVIIFDTDDLVFHPKYIKNFYAQLNALEKKQYAQGVGREFLEDSSVKICTASTKFLAQKLKILGKKVFLVRNILSQKDLQYAKHALSQKERSLHESGYVRIGYFSGSKSHDHDFRSVEDTVIEILQKHAQTILVLAGPLQISKKFDAYTDRIERLSFMERKIYFQELSKIDIQLAPLVTGDPFCEAKSEIKFLEAGGVSVPTIASATQVYQEVITQGRDGYVAQTNEEWKKYICTLIEDEEFREKMGKNARKTVLGHYATQSIPKSAYVRYLQSVLNSGTVKRSDGEESQK